ncbi:hypothetical protein V1519DRAFT_456248 [Lipomyces tetrasporus]
MIGLATLVGWSVRHCQSFVVVVAPLVLSSSLFALSCCRRSFVLVVALVNICLRILRACFVFRRPAL